MYRNSDNLDSRPRLDRVALDEYPDNLQPGLRALLSATHCSLVSYSYMLYRSHATPAASRPLPDRQRPALLPNAHGGAIGRLLPRGAFRSDKPAADAHCNPMLESTPDRRHLQHIADEAGSQDRQTNNGRFGTPLLRINRVGR